MAATIWYTLDLPTAQISVQMSLTKWLMLSTMLVSIKAIKVVFESTVKLNVVL